jgi:murein L,D-transpeptidase YcbB/YkuD
LRKTILIPILIAGTVFLMAQTPDGQTPPKSAATSKKTAAKKKSGANKKTAGKKTAGNWRNSQRTPTADRYKEIQQALASKGYMPQGSPSGVWDASSVEALKKFQQDQSLEPSGKIDSISLIALGLGPKRDSPPVPQP